MSIWTSKAPRIGALVSCLLLGGCMGEGTGTDGMDAPAPAFRAPVLSKADVFGGNVVVAGPEGYCIDRQSLRRGLGGAFVLIASCESLTGETGMVVDPAIMTVSVLPRTLGVEQPTAAELSRLAGPSRVLKAENGDGISLVQLADGGDRILPGGDARHWRGGMLINGHLVGLAAYGPEGSAVAGRQGRQLLIDLAERLLTLSLAPESAPES